MKRVLLTLTFCCAILISFAQSNSINYKAQINDDMGNPLANQAVTLRLSISDGLFVGFIYSETHATNTDANGLVILNIGEGAAESGDYNAIDWAANNHFLNVEVDSGSGFVDLGLSEFHAVPYALTAINGVQDLDDLSDVRNVGGTTNSLYIGHTAVSSTGSGNTSVGNGALLSNTNGVNNVAVGFLALESNTIGGSNTALGRWALRNNSSGVNNTAVGANALSNSMANSNTAVGNSSLSSNTIGAANTALGNWSLRENQSGDENTAIGNLALENNLSNANTAMGHFALRENTTGANNVAIGSLSLTSSTTGNSNTAVGYGTLSSATLVGTSVAIGNNAMSNLTTGFNNIAIGNNAQVELNNGSNQIRMGNTAVSLATIQVGWAISSDRRWKEEIRTLPYGLDFVKQLQPVDYIRKNNTAKTRETGFIAQDVEALLEKVGYTDQGIVIKHDDSKLSLRYNDFIAILVKALQDQQQIIDNQGSAMEALAQRLDVLERTNKEYAEVVAAQN